MNGTRSAFRATRSVDDASIFTCPGTITMSSSDPDNAFLVALSSHSDVLAAYRNHDFAANRSTRTFYRLSRSMSHDHGATWEFRSYMGGARRCRRWRTMGYGCVVSAEVSDVFADMIGVGRSPSCDPRTRIRRSKCTTGLNTLRRDQVILMEAARTGARRGLRTRPSSGETMTERDEMPGCASESVFRTR